MSNTVYTIKVRILSGPRTPSFRRANRTVSRTIEVLSDQTLADLAVEIFYAFNREDDEHLSEFQFGRKAHDRNATCYVADPEDGGLLMGETSLDSLRLDKGSVFWYWFDFGDDWYHELKVTKVGEREEDVTYPRETHRVGASPPQYPDWDAEEADAGGDE